MKGYKFKLEAVLKVRKLKEEQCKMEIGKLQIRITNFKEQIVRHEDGIKEAYHSQEVGLKEGMTGQDLHFYPYFFSGKTAHIDALQREIHILTDKVNEKYEELKLYRAELKVIEKMKEKDKVQYKKKLNKRQFEELEEQVQNWKQALK